MILITTVIIIVISNTGNNTQCPRYTWDKNFEYQGLHTQGADN